jgi:hypothetical protein
VTAYQRLNPGVTEAQAVAALARILTINDQARRSGLEAAEAQTILNLAQAVTSGSVPIETARAIAHAAYPRVNRADIDRAFDAMKPAMTPAT